MNTTTQTPQNGELPEDLRKEIWHVAANIVFQMGDELALTVGVRQATNDLFINFAEKLITEFSSQAYQRGREEVGNEAISWIKEMMPSETMELDETLQKYGTPKTKVANAAMKFSYEQTISFLESLTKD